MKVGLLRAAPILAGLLMMAGCGAQNVSTPYDAGNGALQGPSCVPAGTACDDSTSCCNGYVCQFGLCQKEPVCMQSTAPCGTSSDCCPGLNCVMQCPEQDSLCTCPADGGFCEFRTCE